MVHTVRSRDCDACHAELRLSARPSLGLIKHTASEPEVTAERHRFEPAAKHRDGVA